MRLVIFEGISGSGKTTLYDATRPYIGNEHLMVHRFTPTQWVYDTLYGRFKVDTPALVNLERGLVPLLRPLVVWCILDPDIAHKRKMFQHDENVEPDLERAQMLYWQYFNNYCQFKVARVRTDQLTVNECAWEVLKEFYH